MFRFRLRMLLRIDKALFALAGVFFGIFVAILTSWLTTLQNPLFWGFLALALAIVSIIASIGLNSRITRQIDVPLRTPIRMNDEVARERHARKAYIGFVPFFTPQEPSPAAVLTPSQRLEAAKNLDFDTLFLEISNFKPTINAILMHKHRLKHVWLLSTSPKADHDSVEPGSLAYAKLLAEYLRRRQGLGDVQFHFGVRQDISLSEDSQVVALTYERVQLAFDDAARLGIAADEVVADISTGFRSMVLGMVLASLDKDRDVEFMGAHYGPDGKPTGALYPIIYPFEVHERERAT